MDQGHEKVKTGKTMCTDKYTLFFRLSCICDSLKRKTGSIGLLPSMNWSIGQVRDIDIPVISHLTHNSSLSRLAVVAGNS